MTRKLDSAIEILLETLRLEVKVRVEFGGCPSLDYQGIADFLLKNGRSFEPKPLDTTRWQYMTIGHCYRNSATIAQTEPLRYFEGYATSKNIIWPLLHGWNVDEFDNVVDVTWGPNHDIVPTAYFGVEFPIEYVWEKALSNGHFGLLEYNEDLIADKAHYEELKKSLENSKKLKKLLYKSNQLYYNLING
jgi:hypothetical protein